MTWPGLFTFHYSQFLFIYCCFWLFLNQARAAHAWFLEIALVRTSVCVCVCVCMCVLSVCLFVCLPPRPLITSGVIWCDIGCVRLVKQVLRLFPAFNYFIRHLRSIKMDGRGHFNTAHSERLPKKTKVTRY